MKVLNRYAGLGGNRKLWPEDLDVTAVEMEEKIAAVYRAQFPKDRVIVGDAHGYLLEHFEEFDFSWSSPPCPTHSKMAKATRHKLRRYPDMSLWQEIIFLTHFFKGKKKKWVVENVASMYYEPLIKPTIQIGRHLFWSNFPIPYFEAPEQPKGFITTGTLAECEMLKEWLGIRYEGSIYYKGNHCPGQVLRNCVHPLVGLHILNAAMGVARKEESEQLKIAI